MDLDLSLTMMETISRIPVLVLIGNSHSMICKSLAEIAVKTYNVDLDPGPELDRDVDS